MAPRYCLIGRDKFTFEFVLLEHGFFKSELLAAIPRYSSEYEDIAIAETGIK